MSSVDVCPMLYMLCVIIGEIASGASSHHYVVIILLLAVIINVARVHCTPLPALLARQHAAMLANTQQDHF